MKTINICGKDVDILYCAATENGFEVISGKSAFEINFNSQNDLLCLSLAAIMAAYESKPSDKDGNKPQPPVTSQDLMYEAKPSDIAALFMAVLELRAEWYGIPLVVPKPEVQSDSESEEEDKPKN